MKLVVYLKLQVDGIANVSIFCYIISFNYIVRIWYIHVNNNMAFIQFFLCSRYDELCVLNFET